MAAYPYHGDASVDQVDGLSRNAGRGTADGPGFDSAQRALVGFADARAEKARHQEESAEIISAEGVSAVAYTCQSPFTFSF